MDKNRPNGNNGGRQSDSDNIPPNQPAPPPPPEEPQIGFFKEGVQLEDEDKEK